MSPTSPGSSAPRGRSAGMRLLMLLTLLGFNSFFLTLAALPTWAAQGGAGVAVAGSVTTVMLACTVAVQLLAPTALRRVGPTTVLVFGLVALGAPTPLYLLGHDLWWLALVSAVRGAGFAALTVLGPTLATALAPADRRGEAIGLYGLAIAVPTLVSVPAGAALTLSGHFAWVTAAGASPLLAVPLARGVVRRSATVRPAPADAAQVRGPGEALGIALPSLVLLVVTLSGGGLITFLPIERPDGRLSTVALAVFGVTAALSRWGAGVVADRLGGRRLLPISLVASVVGVAAVAAALHSEASSAEGALVVGALVFGIGYGSVQNLTLVAVLDASPRHGVASAWWNASFDAGTALGASLVGLGAAAGLGVSGSYFVCAILVAATLPLARRPYERTRSSHEE